jgi:fumarate reductase subunit D
LGLTAGLALDALASNGKPAETLRGWGMFGAGAVAAALISPHFVQGLLFPFEMMGTTKLANVAEWQPIDFSQLQPLELAVLAALYFIVTRGVRIPPVRALIVLVLLHMAFQHQRHQIVFALAAPLLLAEPLSRAAPTSAISERTHRLAAFAATGAIILVLSALRLFVPVVRTDSPVAPMSALAHVPHELRTQPLLNDYSFGGYLIFEGVRPFVDSRVELYGDAFLDRYEKIIASDPESVKATLRAYRIRWTILGTHSRAVAVMDGFAGWRRLYADQYAVVHIRDK